MDGLIYGGEYKAAAAAGRIPEAVGIFNQAATKAGKGPDLPKIAEIKLSVSRNEAAARDFAKHTAGRRILGLRRRGYGPEEITRLGVALEDVDLLEQADQEGVSRDRFESLVTGPVIDAICVAGRPSACLAQLQEIKEAAEENGFHQMMYSELGPDPRESVQLLCEEILPGL